MREPGSDEAAALASRYTQSMGEPGREKRCFVHIGTHKTGTTAIQRLLNGSPARLASQGVLYPRSAVYVDGHHNLVFELMGDSRFDASAGTWSDLSDEIAASGAHSVCLSSEAFEYLHDRPDDLAFIRERLERLGLTPVIVLYVRPQAQYAESLFAEAAKHGHTGSFDHFLDEICTAAHLVKLAARFTRENVRLALRWGFSLPVCSAAGVLASFAAALDQRPAAEIARTVLQSLSDLLT